MAARALSARWVLGGLVLASFGAFLACEGPLVGPLVVRVDSGPDADTRTADTRLDARWDTKDASRETGEGGADATDATDATDASAEAMGDVVEAGDAFECGPPLSTSSIATDAGCTAVVQNWVNEGEWHVDESTAVTYCTKPPSSGNHYPFWAAYATYDKPVKYGYLVHALEHGAVVVFYQCASGACKTVQSKLQKVIDARPVDPLCTPPVARRIILVPDPALDVAIAASAWQWTYRAPCLDETSLAAFIDAHYAKSSEDTCFDGITPP